MLGSVQLTDLNVWHGRQYRSPEIFVYVIKTLDFNLLKKPPLLTKFKKTAKVY
jgi:hypothetical protein